jgi:2-iminobutanoate/2-iminopropanoate deaminase
MRRFNPAAVAKPASAYSQGVLHAAGARRLVIAGQVGMRPDGSVPEGLAEQIDVAYANLLAVMADAGMSPRHIVKLNVFALSPEALPLSRAARDRAFAGHPPASTYLQVAALASPAFLFEVDGEAVDEG